MDLGDPGKGKAMDFVGLINELSQRAYKQPAEITVSHLICESSNDLHNNLASVPQGLLFVLLEQRTDLLKHVRETLQTARHRLFERGDMSLFFTFKRLLIDTLQNEHLGSICCRVDALHEM